jgi:REP element-mobilizing transposase RayT
MSSYRRLLYHIVFRTKDNRKSIQASNSDELYSYITGIIKNKCSYLYRINGIEDHIHILCDIHPSTAVSDFLREIKSCSSKWINESRIFPAFDGWADGYGAFTCSQDDVVWLINYIKNQKEHHSKISFEEEYRLILKEAGISIDERYFP